MLGLIESVLSAVHLMAAGAAGVGPFVCLWLERRERRGDPLAVQSRLRLARISITALWLGMGLGAACLGLLWLDPSTRFWRAFSVIPARRLWFGLAELAFYLACMEVYARRWARFPRWGHQLLALLAGSNVLYHFPLLFSAVSVISGHDSETMVAGRTLSWGELVTVFWNPETISRVVHAILAAGVVTGVALMAIAVSVARGRTAAANEPPLPTSASDRGLPAASDVPLAAWGARFALAAAVLQIPVGVWVLLKMPSGLREQLLAVDWAATALFAGALVTMVGLLHHLAAGALGDVSGPISRRCMMLTAVMFLLMVGAGHRARAAAATATAAGALPVIPVVARSAPFFAE